MLTEINSKVTEKLASMRLNLSHLWVLEKMIEGFDVSKFDSYVQGLERKLYVVDDKVTPEGRAFFTSLQEEKYDELSKKDTTKDVGFEEFWKSFPSNDTFEVNGKRFQGSRALKTGKKEEMKAKFDKIIAEGEVTAEQITKALLIEVNQKKQQSVKSNQNKLSFLSAMPAWLNQRIFQSFLDMEEPVGKKPVTMATDI